MTNIKQHTKYCWLRYFDKKTLIVLMLFVLYSSLNLISSLIATKLGLKNPLIVDNSFMSIGSASILDAIGLFSAVMVVIKYSSEIKNNTLLLPTIYGKEKLFVFKDSVFFYIITNTLLFILSVILILIFLTSFNLGTSSLYDFLNLFLHSLSTTFISFLLSISIVFIFKKAIVSILIYMGYSLTETLVGVYYHLKFGYPLELLPLRLSKSFEIYSISSIGLLSIYISILLVLVYFILLKFITSPNIIVED